MSARIPHDRTGPRASAAGSRYQFEYFSHVGVVVDYEDARHPAPGSALLAEQA